MRGNFRPGIGGHDAFRCQPPAVFIQSIERRRQAPFERWQSKQLANHPGGKRQHLIAPTTAGCRQQITAGQTILHAFLAGSGIGVSGIDHQIARRRRS